MINSDKIRLILGGPGCGKTTRLLALVAEELQSGVRPSEIAFVAFTKAAADEAIHRASMQFKLDPKADLPWFRTIHSLAFQSLNLARDEIMSPKDWRAFSAMVREPMKGSYETDSAFGSLSDYVKTGGNRNIGDMMLRIVDYASTTCQSLDEAWREFGEQIDWWRLKRFADALDRYKSEVGKMDFTDILHQFIAHQPPLNVKVAFIDEAQDLTRSQWRTVGHAFQNAERVYIGGDDDQAIYKWAGADVEYFLGLQGKHEILPISHRLPEAVFRLARSIVQRIGHRFEKDFTPSGRPGLIEHHRDIEELDLRSGSWLLLARNGYMLSEYERLCESAGVAYRTRSGDSINPRDVAAIRLWEGIKRGRMASFNAEQARLLAAYLGRVRPALRETDIFTMASFSDWPWSELWTSCFTAIPPRIRDYYISCLRRGEKLTEPSRIRIETIHGVKGAEADHVVLCTDISSRTKETLEQTPDHEHRVFYVGATRARESLHILAPQTALAYAI